MSYDVVTLDTNIFVNNHYNLEHGLLAQLSQFKEGSAQFVLSEIVHRELRRHLVTATVAKRQRLLSLAREAKESGLLSDDAAKQVAALCNEAATPEDAVTRRLALFSEVTGMEIVTAASTSIADLLTYYFAASPPFEPSGAKKKEFPDAIALMSLEAWAKTHDLKLLAISQDAGWAAYAANSSHIDVQPELAIALSSFQTQHSQARAFVESLMHAANNGQAPAFEKYIEFELADVVPELEITAVANSREDFTAGRLRLKLLHVKLSAQDGTSSVTIVRTGANRIAFTVLATLTVAAEATFVFHGWEDEQGSYDYESSDIDHEDWFEANLLFDLHTTGFFPEIQSVEILDHADEFDFGDIESNAAYFARRD